MKPKNLNIQITHLKKILIMIINSGMPILVMDGARKINKNWRMKPMSEEMKTGMLLAYQSVKEEVDTIK